jgi:hypothetical protein
MGLFIPNVLHICSSSNLAGLKHSQYYGLCSGICSLLEFPLFHGDTAGTKSQIE